MPYLEKHKDTFTVTKLARIEQRFLSLNDTQKHFEAGTGIGSDQFIILTDPESVVCLVFYKRMSIYRFLPPTIECGQVKFPVGSVCHSIHSGAMMPLVTWDPMDMLKLVHLGTPRPSTHMRTPPALDMPPDLFKVFSLHIHSM